MLNQSKIKVTIIDDDAQMTVMLKDFIEQKYPSAGITIYHSGEEALERIYEEPDLIILDYHLDSKNPDAMNGVQILKQLKDQFSNVNIIFVSGQDRADVAANTMKFGAAHRRQAATSRTYRPLGAC
jgi:DNA-binding NarL/FixJ family response regulator